MTTRSHIIKRKIVSNIRMKGGSDSSLENSTRDWSKDNKGK